MMVLLVFLGTLNFILVKAMYNAFGSKYAFFANQGVNLLYVAYSGGMLYQRATCTNDIKPGMKLFSHYRFFYLAVLDGLGTFFTAMGAVYTPIQYQPILNQTLIPCTMIASYLFLRHRYRYGALAGATMIFIGACVSVGPALLGDERENTTEYRWYACVIYAASNIPMALSAVYKESVFRARKPLNVWYLCYWVSFYQFFVSFLFVPFLAVPFIGGNDTGTPLSELPDQFYSGVRCWMGLQDDCRCVPHMSPHPESPGQGISCPLGPPMLLIPLYTLVNFVYNMVGLIMTKHGSAVLRYISYAIILPLTTIVGSAVFESIVTPFTYAGLVVVLAGFALYQSFAGKTKKPARSWNRNSTASSASGSMFEETDSLEVDADEFTAANTHLAGSSNAVQSRPFSPPWNIQSSFQERVIGMGAAHTEGLMHESKYHTTGTSYHHNTDPSSRLLYSDDLHSPNYGGRSL
jgi:drug/metabolite transporter (DMT)-like permease